MIATHNVQEDGSILVGVQNESLCDTDSANELLDRLQTLGMNNLRVRLGLSLDECKVTDWSFLQAPGLVSLRIYRCRCKTSLFLLAESLPPQLECLQLKHCSLDESTSSAGPTLLDALQRLSNLNRLEITLCRLRDLTMIRLGSRIQHLHLDENLVDNLDWLADQTMTSGLTSLSLSDNNLGTYHLHQLVHVPCLQELDVSHNEICAGGIQCLLHANLPLTRLNLQSCWLGHRGAMYVAQLIQSTPTLEYLHLGGNVWGDVGILRIVHDGLVHSASIQFIDFDDNNMSEEGALAVAAVASHHISLHGLGLSRNRKISSHGWMALATAIIRNPKLDHVTTFGNGFLEAGVDLIRLHLDVVRTEKFRRLLGEERSPLWPLLLSRISLQSQVGYQLMFELLRLKPSIVV
ncbi:Leucine Rich Repeat [Fragilaria crotonensis]|nr:Leucine Rich Repeat [Fragilaria crotonensis]